MFGGLAIAPTNDQILAGNKKAIEMALTGAGADSLAADSEFERAAALVSKEAWGVFYYNYRKMIEALIGFAANKAEIQQASMMNAGAQVALKLLEGFGQSLGDDPQGNGAKIMKYSAAGLATIETNTDGVRLTGVQLKPKD